jgi:dipeptidyl aminopeptidase/acylaminoacyl peptidase
MKKFILPAASVAITFAFLIGGYMIWSWFHPQITSPFLTDKVRQRNLSKYSFESLALKSFVGSPLRIQATLSSEAAFTSYQFSFLNDEGNKVTGMLNIPEKKRENLPVILMLRGYVDKDIYSTGVGTRPAGAVFARNGYIVVSPDFLGFGGSDPESADILEARFEKPSTVLSLLASLRNHPLNNPKNGQEIILKKSPLMIWAHSNGGQIALSILEITRMGIPTTLWAPVSLSFPESVTHFLPDLPDKGAYIRKDLSDFDSRYEGENYSIANYWPHISAPIQLHQGGLDDAVLPEWSANLAKTLNLSLNINYFYYPNSDHQLRSDWNTVVARDLTFFEKHLP